MKSYEFTYMVRGWQVKQVRFNFATDIKNAVERYERLLLAEHYEPAVIIAVAEL